MNKIFDLLTNSSGNLKGFGVFLTLLGVCYLIYDNKKIKENITQLTDKFKQLIRELAKKDIVNYEDFFKNLSPKAVTEKGKELLKKVHIDEFLKECELLDDIEKFKNKENVGIYTDSLRWVSQNQQEPLVFNKIAEMSYTDSIDKEGSLTLLALAIHDEIISRLGRKTANH